MSNETMPACETPATAKPSLGRRLWNFPVTRILAYLLLFAGLCLVFGLALGLPVGLALTAAHIPFRQGSEVWALLGESVMALAAVGAFLLMGLWADRRSPAALGLERRGLARDTAMGLLLGGGVFSVVIGLMAALGAYHVGGINAHFQPLIPLLLFLAVAVCEETIFRGYIFQTLEARWGSGIALAVSAVLFGLVHLGNPVGGLTPGLRLVGPVFIVFEASILMTAGYLLTRRLWLPIGIHWGWNFFESAVYGTSDSGFGASPVYMLLRSHVSGLFPVTGGPFGPEASVICLVVSTGAGLLLLRQAVLKGQWRPRRRSTHSHLSNLEVNP